VGRTTCGKRTQTHCGGERNYKVRAAVLNLDWLLMNRPGYREDDTNWPKKNIVGKQELEIRVGNDHIAFEVRSRVFRGLNCLY
jgi:hypothetical protein